MIYTTYAIVAASVILALFLPVQRAFLLAVFLMPFVAFSIYVGVSVNVSQFVTIIVLLRMLPNSRPTNLTMKTFLPLIIFVLWGFAAAYITLEFYATNSIVAEGSFFRNGWGRVLSQTIVFIINFGLLYVFLAAKPPIDPRSIAIAFIRACVVLVAIGYAQIFTFIYSGSNVLPIGGFSDEYSSLYRDEAILQTPFGQILRMSSLGGEPKGLAMSLVIGCSVLLGFWRFIPRSAIWKLSVLTFLFSGIVSTGSTSGFFATIIVGMMMSLGFYIRRPLRTSMCVAFAICISLANYGLYFTITSWASDVSIQRSVADDSVAGLFLQRTIDRFGLDDTDTIIISSLAADSLQALIGRGMGLSHIGAEAFLPDYYLRQGYYYGQIINAKSGLTNYGGMTGAAGLVLLSTFFGILVGVSSRTHMSPDRTRLRQAVVLQILAFTLFAVMLNRLYASNISWLFIASCGYTTAMLVRSRPSTGLAARARGWPRKELPSARTSPTTQLLR